MIRVVVSLCFERNDMSSSRFLGRLLLRWGIALVLTTALIIQWIFPSSFGIPPSLRLWKLAFNSVILISWIVISGYIWKANSPFSFTFQPRSFRQLLMMSFALFMGATLIFIMAILTNGQPLDFAMQSGLFLGTIISLGPILITFLRWVRHRGAK
jgi:hypothetical protein